MLGATSHLSPNRQFPLGFLLLPNKAPTNILISATAQPRRQLQASKKEQQEKQSELTGLNVLRAMQRAAAVKNKVKGKSKRKGGVVKSIEKEEEDKDYSNVRPLMVKSEWSVKLDELEKRLQELTETK